MRLAALIASIATASGGTEVAWPFPSDAALLGQLSPKLPEVEKAQTQIEAGDFEEAVKTLQRGLSQPDVTDDQLAELYRLLGLAQLYLGNEDKAREAFEKLLQARPDFELPRSEPPKIRALYARIKEDIKTRRLRPVVIHFEPLPDVRGGGALEATVRIDDMALGAKAKLYYRRAGGQAYSSVDFARQKGSKDRFRASIPSYELPDEGRAYEMEYYVEVADAAQRRLAGKGDPYNPLRFQVVPQKVEPIATAEGEPWYKRPWVWVGVGVIAAGATAGIVIAATSKQTGTLPITIRVEGYR